MMRSCLLRQSRVLAPVAAAAALLLGATSASAATFDWQTGAFSASGVPNPLAAGDVLTLSTNSPTIKQFNVPFTNNGTVQHLLGGGTVYLSGGSAVVNNGLWEEQGADVFSTSAGGGSFTNNGTYRKTSAGTSTVAPTSLVNTGTIDIQQGTMSLGGGFASNAGVLMGSGAISAPFGINNSGTLAPGSFGAGTLALNGNYTQTGAGTFAVDLTNMASKDLFNITGTANLTGTLALNCLGACSFALGDSFTILSTSSVRTGSFSNVTFNGFSSPAFNVTYGPTSVGLLVTQNVTAVPEPASVAMFLSGLALLGFARSRRRA